MPGRVTLLRLYWLGSALLFMLESTERKVALNEAPVKYFKTLRGKYLERRQAELKTLRFAFEKQDSATIRKIAHHIRGSAGMYGFAELGRIASQIGAEAKDQSWTTLGVTINLIENHLKSLNA